MATEHEEKAKKELENKLRKFAKKVKDPAFDVSKAIPLLADEILQSRKICTKCGIVYPALKKYFASHPRTRDNFQVQCRACQAGQTFEPQVNREGIGDVIFKDWKDDFVEWAEGKPGQWEESYIDWKET